jgi:hypothetical protein
LSVALPALLAGLAVLVIVVTALSATRSSLHPVAAAVLLASPLYAAVQRQVPSWSLTKAGDVT